MCLEHCCVISTDIGRIGATKLVDSSNMSLHQFNANLLHFGVAITVTRVDCPP